MYVCMYVHMYVCMYSFANLIACLFVLFVCVVYIRIGIYMHIYSLVRIHQAK